jgi:hypothetical protein
VRGSVRSMPRWAGWAHDRGGDGGRRGRPDGDKGRVRGLRRGIDSCFELIRGKKVMTERLEEKRSCGVEVRSKDGERRVRHEGS